MSATRRMRGFYYLIKYEFSTKGRWVSKANYATTDEAISAFKKAHGVKWKAD